MTDERDGGRWWQTRGGLVLFGFLAIAGFFLATEHTAHLFGILPYLLLLACPLMHMFMHRRHQRPSSRDGGAHDHGPPPHGQGGAGGTQP